MSDERTEKPTGYKLRKAREQGQVPRSRDLGQAGALVAAVFVLSWMGGGMMTTLASAVRRSLLRMGEQPLAGIGAAEVTTIAVQSIWTLMLVSGPLAVAGIVAVVAMQTAQGGLIFTGNALSFDLKRLSPAQGLKRLGFSQGGISLIKAVVSTTVILYFGWKSVRAGLESSPGLTRVSALAAAQVGWAEAMTLARKAAIAMFVLAGADYGVQRWQFMKSQRMTKEEVKEEHKQLEGNPEIKGRVRRMQRDLMRRRMLAAVPRATVVITNPTHFAVALEYTRGTLPAPRVVAKGQDYLAKRIREIAREHGVPIVENPPLARALYKESEVGDMIPGALFEAVAEVLAYLIRLRQLVL